MSDNIEAQQQQHQQQLHTEEQSESSEASTMAEIENSEAAQQATPAKPAAAAAAANVSFSIWPPTQRTRDAVIKRLIETLTTPSILAKRYGVVPQDEASETAKRIEEEAFVAAGAGAGGGGGSNDDGVEILQVYSKEISKRMLDTVKARSASAAVVKEEAESKPSAEESPENDSAETVDNES